MSVVSCRRILSRLGALEHGRATCSCGRVSLMCELASEKLTCSVESRRGAVESREGDDSVGRGEEWTSCETNDSGVFSVSYIAE